MQVHKLIVQDSRMCFISISTFSFPSLAFHNLKQLFPFFTLQQSLALEVDALLLQKGSFWIHSLLDLKSNPKASRPRGSLKI